MGRVAKLIKSTLEKFIIQTVEMYIGANVTAEQFAPSGDDSPPLENDRVILVPVDGTGNFVSVGVLCMTQGAKPGEKIFFSRDSDGNAKAIFKLLSDGKIESLAPGGYDFKSEKDIELAIKKDFKIKAEGDGEIKGENIKIEGKVEVTGGNFKCKGKATPSGTGCLCALDICPVSGAIHVGDTASNT